MGATYVNSYQPTGVTTPATDEDKAINIYNNQKRRLYHWADEPPGAGGDINDPTYNQNVFGWCLCGRHASQGCTIAKAAGLGTRQDLPSPATGPMRCSMATARSTSSTRCAPTTSSPEARPITSPAAPEISADNTLESTAVAEGRACPGFLLCGDDPIGYVAGYNSWQRLRRSRHHPSWTGNMNMRTGEAFNRPGSPGSTSIRRLTPTPTAYPASPMPPSTMKPTRTIRTTSTSSTGSRIPSTRPRTPRSTSATRSPTAAGPMVPIPSRRTSAAAAYQDLLYSSTNISTYYQDGLTPDLHVNALGTMSEAVFEMQVPYYHRWMPASAARSSGPTAAMSCHVYLSGRQQPGRRYGQHRHWARPS